PLIARWLDTLERQEIVPTLAPIPGVSYDAYLAKVTERFANPEVGDTIRRLCLDGSNRQPKFILPTLAQALAADRPHEGLALEVALWCRYCAGIDEAGRAIAPNDENWAELGLRAQAAKDDPGAFLANRAVFGALGEEPRFAAAFARHLGRLWSEGVHPVLADYIG